MKETKDQIRSITINFNLSLHADHEVYNRLEQYLSSSDSFFYDKEDVIKYLIEEGLDSVTNQRKENKSMAEIENIPNQIFEYQSKSSVFAKGQIWFWKDPVYGYKSYKSERPVLGDGTMRYSRHVLIVQEPNTFNNLTALVVPFSSHPCDQYDVLVHKIYNGKEDISYARTNLCYPVNVSQLTRYLCTLSQETTAIIMLRISQLLHGNIISSIISRYITDNMGIDIPPLLTLSDDNKSEKIIDVDNDVINDSEDEEDDIAEVAVEIKVHREETQNIVDEETLKIPNKEVDDSNTHSKSRREYKKADTRLIKINGGVSEPKIIKSSQWTRSQKVEFYNYYITNGTKATVKKYNLKEGSVYSKISFIKDEIQQGLYLYQDNNDSIPDIVEQEIDEKYINSTEFRNIVSDFAKYIKYTMSTNRNFEKFKTNMTKSSNNNFIYFYDHISSGIYISLMTMLGLMESLSNPKLKKGDIETFKKHKNTIDTLMEFYYANRDKEHIYMNYCTDNVTYNFDDCWKDILLTYFKIKFNKNSYKLYELTNYIVLHLCGKK